MVSIGSSAINVPPQSLAAFNPIPHLFRVFDSLERRKFHLPVCANTALARISTESGSAEIQAIRCERA